MLGSTGNWSKMCSKGSLQVLVGFPCGEPAVGSLQNFIKVPCSRTMRRAAAAQHIEEPRFGFPVRFRTTGTGSGLGF